MMFSLLTKWIRDQLLSVGSSCARRGLCSRHHSLWILFIIFVICIAIQTFVAHQARNYKLPGQPHLRVFSNKEHWPSPVRDVWEGSLRQTERPVEKSLLSAKTSFFLPETSQALSHHLHHHNQGVESPSLQTGVDSRNLATRSWVAARGVLPGERFLSKGRTKASSRKRPKNTVSRTNSLEMVNNVVPADSICQPKSHIYFLKTHKTASSTILNILYRYGESRNLTFALPLNRHSQLFYPHFFASHFVEGVSSRSVKEFNIMCNHMRFRKSEVVKVMPVDTFYFSILRHPVSMMESIFTYYKSIPAFQKTQSLDSFLKNSWRSYNASVTNNHYAHNVLAFDFGFENNVNEDAVDFGDRASVAIAAIQRDFHLILISEYFDESMILLKHALCWSLEDVLSFKLNSRSKQTRHALSPNTTQKIKRWNALDWRIYLHFNTTFWHKVDSQIGKEQMKREVLKLRELQAKLTHTCLKEGVAVDPSHIKDVGLKPFQYGAAVIQGYNLNPDIDEHTKMKCQRFITPELQYTNRLYTQQFPELTKNHKKAARILAIHSDKAGMKG